MSYETEQRKLYKINQSTQKVAGATDNLKKIDLVPQPTQLLKKNQVIHLIQGYLFTQGIIKTPFDTRIKILQGGPNQVNVRPDWNAHYVNLFFGPQSLPLSDFAFVPMRFYIDLVNFPEQYIPFTKLLVKTYGDSAYELPKGNSQDDDFPAASTYLQIYLHHWWQNVKEDHWRLYAEFSARGFQPESFAVAPLYVDLDLFIFDANMWDELKPVTV